MPVIRAFEFCNHDKSLALKGCASSVFGFLSRGFWLQPLLASTASSGLLTDRVVPATFGQVSALPTVAAFFLCLAVS